MKKIKPKKCCGGRIKVTDKKDTKKKIGLLKANGLQKKTENSFFIVQLNSTTNPLETQIQNMHYLK